MAFAPSSRSLIGKIEAILLENNGIISLDSLVDIIAIDDSHSFKDVRVGVRRMIAISQTMSVYRKMVSWQPGYEQFLQVSNKRALSKAGNG